MEPKNLSAQINPKIKGNPVSSRLESTISNFYPGLEMDMRNIWRKIFKGITIHEATNQVIAVDDDDPKSKYAGFEGRVLSKVIIGDSNSRKVIPLEVIRFPENGGLSHKWGIEWANALPEIIAYSGQEVTVVFRESHNIIKWSESSAPTAADQQRNIAAATDQDINSFIVLSPTPEPEQYCVFDLGSIYDLNEVRIAPGRNTNTDEFGDFSGAFPRNFKIQIGNNPDDWSSVGSAVNELNYIYNANQWNAFSFSPKKGRYVRFSVRNQPDYISPSGSNFGPVIVVGDFSFIGLDGDVITRTTEVTMTVNTFFLSQNNENTKVIAKDLAEPGELTQSLCSPWQADYRECGCFYWAASRPDYIAVKDGENIKNRINWLQRDRSENADNFPDNTGDVQNQYSYEDLYRDWEKNLRFVIDGADDPNHPESE